MLLLDFVSSGCYNSKKLSNSQNNLGFGLCTAPFVCYMVTTLNNLMKSERELSTDGDVLLLNTRN